MSTSKVTNMASSRSLNNTLIYGANGFCVAPAPLTDTGCTTWRGGQYNELASKTKKLPESEGVHPVDSAPFPKANYALDTLTINDVIPIKDYPMGIVQNYWGQEAYHPMMAIGLGEGSTLLRRLKDEKKIASRSWADFYGRNGGSANAQTDRNFVIGSYDRAKTAGKGLTLPLTEPTDGCPSRMLVTISDVEINFPNGTANSLFTDGLSSSISACLVLDYPILMALPLSPYLTSFRALTNATVAVNEEGREIEEFCTGGDSSDNSTESSISEGSMKSLSARSPSPASSRSLRCTSGGGNGQPRRGQAAASPKRARAITPPCTRTTSASRGQLTPARRAARTRALVQHRDDAGKCGPPELPPQELSGHGAVQELPGGQPRQAHELAG
jgi:hypothetical protein